jgi:hypothetical protein
MGKRKATKELTVGEMVAQQKAELATQAMNPTSWGKVTLTKNDLIIPRLQLVQAMSEIVAQKKAAPGEIRDSLNNVLMAKEGITLEVIPLFVHKRFKVNKLIEGKGGKVEKEFHEMIKTPRQSKESLCRLSAYELMTCFLSCQNQAGTWPT